MPTTRKQLELWPGPLRPTPQRKAIHSTRCVRCRGETINGDAWCYACKDPDGYADRLAQAHRDAQQRCLEAYPVCRHCGKSLSAEAVASGQTAHAWSRGKQACLMPDEL